MIRKIAYLLVICMLFGAAATLVSCTDKNGTVDGSSEPSSDSNSNTDSDNMENSDADNGNIGAPDTDGSSSENSNTDSDKIDNTDTDTDRIGDSGADDDKIDNTDTDTDRIGDSGADDDKIDNSDTDSDKLGDSVNDNGGASKPENVKSIDLYIIAGQSNATGHTKYDEALLASLWSDYKVGSSNVLYRGRSEYTLNVNTENVSTGVNEVYMWTNAKAGQGKTTAQMGAEVGMAATLSSTYYTGDKVCGIIKYAHGGTSIFNSKIGENAANGNWVSPSYADLIGVEYNGLTGNLYRNLLDEVRTSITQLERSG